MGYNKLVYCNFLLNRYPYTQMGYEDSMEAGIVMTIKEIVRTFILTGKSPASHQLYTRWGENIDTNNILTEYPRPQLVRDNYAILNGPWEYAITKNRKQPGIYDGQIIVPFSPESTLSGVNRQVYPEDTLWYKRDLDIDNMPDERRCILHFGAVDQYCEIYLNNICVKKHVGGYIPFSCDITSFLHSGKNQLVVKVIDYSDSSYHSRGKQKLKRGGMFYTAQSGIWQTVWMEWVPEQYITGIKITPYLEEGTIGLELYLNHWNNSLGEPQFSISIQMEDKEVCNINGYGHKFLLPISSIRPWSPEDPFLYGLTINFKEDRIQSYFAMRSFAVKEDKQGIPRVFLNGKPYYQNGVLDQGYWPDGLYTPPSDEAFVYDILKMKELGFNMLRKHIKIEPLRWYYHCDRLGMIVWQDMVNGGEAYNKLLIGYLPILFPNFIKRIKDNRYALFARLNEKGRKAWLKDCKETIELLYNCPSIAVWVPFNEGWGQFDSKKVVNLIKKVDKTRLIDQASGWFDQKGGDFLSIHNYFRKLKIKPEKRAIALSEFAGFACHIKEHSYSDKIYGYQIYKDKKELNNEVQRLFEKDMKEYIKKGLSASVFTQLSDVEEEVNGLLTYDRKVCKIDKVKKPILGLENLK